MRQDEQINIRMSANLKQLAQDKADIEDMPLSQVIKILLKKWIKNGSSLDSI
jgi:antitoxin component of RelBE/YafQ-DinJ toxin-antitoxin module